MRTAELKARALDVAIFVLIGTALCFAVPLAMAVVATNILLEKKGSDHG